MGYTHFQALSVTTANGLAYGAKGSESKLIDGSTGAVTLPSTANVTGDLSVATNKFTVAAATGNTAVAGTLGVTGASTLSSTLGVTGDFAVNTNKFTVTAASGNTLAAGTLSATGDFAVATNKFTVAAATGNTVVAGTLGVTGDVAVATNKLTVAAATGNTAVAGTLTLNGNLVPNTFCTSTTVQGANAATAANYGVFFIAPFACTVVSVREAHTAPGTDAAAVTLDIEKLTGTQAPDAGVAVLGATKIDLKGAANTVQAPALSGTAADLTLAAGDRLCLKDAGVLTAVAGVAVTVQFKGA